MTVRLSAFDLVPLSEGYTPAEGIDHARAFARGIEEAGYHRLWYGEHHLNPGMLGYSPALTIALLASETGTLRFGSGTVLTGHRTPFSVAEEFSLLEAAFPGRIDLGLGRAGLKGPKKKRTEAEAAKQEKKDEAKQQSEDYETDNGVFIPASPDLSHLFGSPRAAAQQALLHQPGAEPRFYDEYLDQLLDLFHDRAVVHGEPISNATADVGSPEIWILGTNAGDSSQLAAEKGLRFGANYHVAPTHTLEALADYRERFQPSEDLNAPYTIVSAEVLVADTTSEADTLAAGYDQWVYSIRSGQGAITYPSPETAAQNQLTAEQQPLVRDRTTTRYVGDPHQVVEKLKVLQAATQADELLISTITHDPEARLRSFQLLAEAWQ
ncbi:LLM class flavin-dependent oxidoreductase [Auritidibacter ignavus]|uniref:LLM class flavin-dependent oxidoreductase n=1 Tax=Auritidibacter ignavus TaxID=678932 RepID=UPI0024BAF5B1|nr:LLM class flavin-dependent oxidoreductase [Auritidibacter ignavus]WHS28234.1 LLM class flavin-dependent oxidoreductase [Auritidibacter ignavus]